MKKQLLKIRLLLLVIAVNGAIHAQSTSIDTASYVHLIKVACVGASTTYGANILNNPLNSFPAQLERLLGDKWDVRNFGVNSTGVLKKGEFPYWNTDAFKASLDFNPDIVLLNLGVNDVKPQNWKYKADFFSDYKEIIRLYRNLPSHPKIYLCREIPVFQDHWGITAKMVNGELYPMKKTLAQNERLPIIDLYTPLLKDSAWFSDGIHPNAKGAKVMATIIAETLIGKALHPDNAIYPGKKSEWFGFECYDFWYNLLNAKLVIPRSPAEGHPWVWRARFWGWHPEMDSILLSKGFSIFYLNTAGMLGSPRAITYWNELYNYLVSNYQLNKRFALEGVSRGALFIYAFAKKYPKRVTCLYAEAPVCDIKSWPGGFEKSPGDKSIWKSLLKEYHFTEGEALAYKGNPIDSLEKLAKYKIPIWHSIGLHDSLAPPEENTFILANRYMRLGGEITVYPNTKGRTELHGHHFPIDDPAAGANFIMYNYFKAINH